MMKIVEPIFTAAIVAIPSIMTQRTQRFVNLTEHGARVHNHPQVDR